MSVNFSGFFICISFCTLGSPEHNRWWRQKQQRPCGLGCSFSHHWFSCHISHRKQFFWGFWRLNKKFVGNYEGLPVLSNSIQHFIVSISVIFTDSVVKTSLLLSAIRCDILHLQYCNYFNDCYDNPKSFCRRLVDRILKVNIFMCDNSPS